MKFKWLTSIVALSTITPPLLVTVGCQKKDQGETLFEFTGTENDKKKIAENVIEPHGSDWTFALNGVSKATYSKFKWVGTNAFDPKDYTIQLVEKTDKLRNLEATFIQTEDLNDGELEIEVTSGQGDIDQPVGTYNFTLNIIQNSTGYKVFPETEFKIELKADYKTVYEDFDWEEAGLPYQYYPTVEFISEDYLGTQLETYQAHIVYDGLFAFHKPGEEYTISESSLGGTKIPEDWVLIKDEQKKPQITEITNVCGTHALELYYNTNVDNPDYPPSSNDDPLYPVIDQDEEWCIKAEIKAGGVNDAWNLDGEKTPLCMPFESETLRSISYKNRGYNPNPKLTKEPTETLDLNNVKILDKNKHVLEFDFDIDVNFDLTPGRNDFEKDIFALIVDTCGGESAYRTLPEIAYQFIDFSPATDADKMNVYVELIAAESTVEEQPNCFELDKTYGFTLYIGNWTDNPYGFTVYDNIYFNTTQS